MIAPNVIDVIRVMDFLPPNRTEAVRQAATPTLRVRPCLSQCTPRLCLVLQCLELIFFDRFCPYQLYSESHIQAAKAGAVTSFERSEALCEACLSVKK